MASHPDPVPVIRDETRQKLGLLTPEELAVTLEVTPTTLQTWRCEGKGPRFIKLGKGVFYRFADVKEWIDDTLNRHPEEVAGESSQNADSGAAAA